METSMEARLKELIAAQANVDAAAITAESSLEDLDVTSLNLVELIMTIEDEYDVEIPIDAVDAWKSFKTVGDIIALGRSLGLENRAAK